MATYLHGTCYRLQPGDTLVPGKEIGKDYGRSSHVYFVTDDFSVDSNAPQADLASSNPYLYALVSAEKWAEAALMMAREEGQPEEHLDLYVYEVEPVGEIEFDGDDYAGPESRRARAAKIIRLAEGY